MKTFGDELRDKAKEANAANYKRLDAIVVKIKAICEEEAGRGNSSYSFMHMVPLDDCVVRFFPGDRPFIKAIMEKIPV